VAGRWSHRTCSARPCTLRARPGTIETRSVIHLASENGALPGGKVGGIGDVVRDLPNALAAAGWDVTVATPSYGSLHRLPEAKILTSIDVEFRGEPHSVGLWQIPSGSYGVRNLVFEHRLFAEHGTGQIYIRDDDRRPFASDADRFAFFCAAAAQYVFASERLPDVVHLHDWHSTFYILLTHFAERYRHLKDIRTVFTVHNLSYQGIRPLAGDASSLQSWFPEMEYDYESIVDPRYDDCVNPMAAAIRLADRVSTVSPTYAEEICRPSDRARGFVGGEGLEDDLRDAHERGRLAGILNGCDYDEATATRPGWQELRSLMRSQVETWAQRQPGDEAQTLALRRLEQLPNRRPNHVLTSVGRLVSQKAELLLYEIDDDASALQRIAEHVGTNGVMLLLGSGDPHVEQRLLQQVRETPNVVFLRGYSESLADPLYASGDLFLMPSSFEPCGISQMRAMRAGQPCVVHGVGGLRDTVEHGVSGFVFDGNDPHAQAGNFVQTTVNALQLRSADPIRWHDICREAEKRRFDWQSCARQTIETLYGEQHD
jgi:starch synthase